MPSSVFLAHYLQTNLHLLYPPLCGTYKHTDCLLHSTVVPSLSTVPGARPGRDPKSDPAFPLFQPYPIRSCLNQQWLLPSLSLPLPLETLPPPRVDREADVWTRDL